MKGREEGTIKESQRLSNLSSFTHGTRENTCSVVRGLDHLEFSIKAI